MNPILIGVLVYVVAQLAVGLFVSRRIANEADYLLAGRRLGYGLATFSLFATWFGAESCLGAAGATYAEGLRGGRADPFGYTLCLLLMGLVYAAPMRRRGAFTFADLFRDRYAPAVEKLVVLMLAPASILWGAAQIRALGQVLSVSSQIDLTWTIALAAAVVIVYTMFGGLRADVTTDLLQGIALIAGLGLLLVVVVRHLGGPAAAWTIVRREPLGLASVPGTSSLEAMEVWLVPIIGSITAQELAARVLACRTPALARNTSLIASAMYLVVGLVPVTLGLLGAQLMPGLGESEGVIPALAARHLGSLAQVVLLGTLISAILSTVDSNLLSASSLVSHNVILPRWRGATEPQKILVARIAVVASGLVACWLAFSRDSVYGLVEEASAFGGGGLAVVMTFGLFTRFGGMWSALAAMATSIVVQVGGAYLWRWPHPMTTSIGVSLVAYVVVALVERRRESGMLVPSMDS